VSHILAAILQTAGYKTGLYTSPHLRDFRERIKVNGEMPSEKFVVDFTERIKPEIEKFEPSFFEITVAMAFEYFAREKVDVAVIETGLGGRLDSTNIITPDLSLITNIGWDHMNMLGDTLEKIATEKAGIIKKEVPVVIGEVIPETENIFRQAADEKNAPLFIASHKWQAIDWKWENHELIIEVEANHRIDRKKYHLDLPGIYQVKNLLTVLEACSQLQQIGWNINEQQILHGLKYAKKITALHGRWEILHTTPLVVADVAHNEDGIRQLVQQIKLTAHKKLHIIIGMVKDKDIEGILCLLPRHANYYFTKAPIPRAMPEAELQHIAAKQGLKGKRYSNVNTALYGASVNAAKEDMIVVCGSIFLVGEILPQSIKAIWSKESEAGLLAGFLEIIGASG
jgi:dihydrofolate synthase/folylpolyglutamate synthase